jgi:hypothetical protein
MNNIICISFKTIKIFIISFFMLVSIASDQAFGQKDTTDHKKILICFSGVYGFGIDNGTALDYWGGKPIESAYGFGVLLDFSITKSFHAFLDANYYTMRVPQADEGETVYSNWVFEQTGYSTGYITPPTDVYYYMNTTMFRLGGKYSFSISKKLDVWYGLGVGFCKWNASYDTKDRKKTYGSEDGFLVAPFFLMLGLDMKLSGFGKVTLFLDGGSPVAEVKIEDLFIDGWTWEASKHIMVPYRIGISIGMSP